MSKGKSLQEKNRRTLFFSVVMVVLYKAVVIAVIIALCIHWEVPRRIRLMVPGEYSLEDDVERYMEERYGEEFVVKYTVPYTRIYYRFYMYPKGAEQYDDNMITVRAWRTGGLVRYVDDYPLIKMKPKYADYISNVVSEYFPDNKVYIYADLIGYEDNLDISYSLEDFLNGKSEHVSTAWDICVPANNMTDSEILDKSNAAVAALVDKKIRDDGWICIMYCDNYEKLPEHREKGMLGRNGIDFVDLRYYITPAGEFDRQTEIEK